MPKATERRGWERSDRRCVAGGNDAERVEARDDQAFSTLPLAPSRRQEGENQCPRLDGFLPRPLAGEARRCRRQRCGEGGSARNRGLETGRQRRYEHTMPVDRDPWLIVRARQLRSKQTNAETLLWHKLRARRLAGYRFRRQHPIGPYVVDFVCLDASLVVEVDGATHEDPARDERRDRDLATRGFRTIRVWNSDVYENLDGVIDMILNRLLPPSP